LRPDATVEHWQQCGNALTLTVLIQVKAWKPDSWVVRSAAARPDHTGFLDVRCREKVEKLPGTLATLSGFLQSGTAKMM